MAGEAEDGESDQAGIARDASSLAAITGTLESEGYATSFASRGAGAVRCAECGAESDAAAFPVDQFRRLEGASDPEEMLAVAAMRCPACGAYGTLVLTYGPMASEEDADVLGRLQEPPPPRPHHVREAEPEEGS
jgi:hypothetical protein